MIILLQQIKKLFVLRVVYEEQYAEVHKHVAAMHIKWWDLKQQPIYQVRLILFVLKEA